MNKPTNLSNLTYLIAIFAMMLIAIGLIAIIAIFRPQQDLTIAIGAVFAFLTPTTLSLMSFLKANETHLIVNSRMDEFKQLIEKSSKAEGVQEGIAQATEAGTVTVLLPSQNLVPPKS